MKNINTIILSLLLLNSFILSQSSFGIEGGINLSDVSTSMRSEIEPQMRSGFYMGVNIEAELNDASSIITGLNYVEKGNTFKNDDLKLTQVQNYIELPVTINFKAKGKKLTPTFGVGFYFSFLRKALHKEEYTAGDYYEYDTKEEFDANDFGFLVDAGLNYRISELLQVYVKGSYYIGTKNILSEEMEKYGDVRNKGPRFATGLKISI